MEKKSFIFNLLFVFAFLAILSGAGCVTNRNSSEPIVLEHQRKIAELEAELEKAERRNTQLTEIIDEYNDSIREANEQLENIRERGRGMEGEIDAIILEFREYQQIFKQILRRNRELEDKIKNIN